MQIRSIFTFKAIKLQKMAKLAENEVIANKNLLAPYNPRSKQRELFSFGIAEVLLENALNESVS